LKLPRLSDIVDECITEFTIHSKVFGGVDRVAPYKTVAAIVQTLECRVLDQVFVPKMGTEVVVCELDLIERVAPRNWDAAAKVIGVDVTLLVDV
jgi:hypothetical protein